jgi:hypothetical protein
MAAISRQGPEWAEDSTGALGERLCWIRRDETRPTGEQVTLPTFWGSDEAEARRVSRHAWSIPNIDGYKTAFFHPPYGLQGSAGGKAALFAGINRFVLGDDPTRAKIFFWSTDWSNYFDDGHEWWGDFYWTIRPAVSDRLVVVGASTTD